MFDLESKESVKTAIRVDHDFDNDSIMNVYLPGAINEVKTTVSLNDEDKGFYENNPLFNLAVLNIVAHHNDNRSITSNEQSVDVPASSLALIQSLRSNLATLRRDNIEVIADES